MKRGVIAALIILLSLVSSLAQGPILPGPGLPVGAPSFQGAGDVVASATIWGSCARVYKASLASTSTLLCDLVDSAAPTTVICTLRGTTSGFVDLVGSYCTGSVTPATKCAAATGGVCNVSKVYNQVTPGTDDFTETTAATQPTLGFNKLGGLPGLVFAGAQFVVTPNNITSTLPYTFSAVAERTTFPSNFSTISSEPYVNDAPQLFFNNVANQVNWNPVGGTSTLIAANDNAFHAMQANSNTGTDIVYVDGSNASGTGSGSTGANVGFMLGASSFGAGQPLTGVIMEWGYWSVFFSSTQAGNMNTNQHGASSGYNF